MHEPAFAVYNKLRHGRKKIRASRASGFGICFEAFIVASNGAFCGERGTKLGSFTIFRVQERIQLWKTRLYIAVDERQKRGLISILRRSRMESGLFFGGGFLASSCAGFAR